MGRLGMTAATNDASVQCPPGCLVKDDKNHLHAMADIFQLRIVLLHYCVWVDLFVVYMLPIFPGKMYQALFHLPILQATREFLIFS